MALQQQTENYIRAEYLERRGVERDKEHTKAKAAAWFLSPRGTHVMGSFLGEVEGTVK